MIVFVRSRTAFGKYVSFRDLPVLRHVSAQFSWIGPDTVVADIGDPGREDLPAVLFGGAPPPGWLDFIEVLEIGTDAAAAPPFVDEDIGADDDDADEDGAADDADEISGDDDRPMIATATAADEDHHGYDDDEDEDVFEPHWREEYDDPWDWSGPPSRYVADRPGTSIISGLSPKGAPERPSFGRKLLAVCFEAASPDHTVTAVRRRLDAWLKGKHPGAVWHGRRLVALCFVDQRPARLVLEDLKPILECDDVLDYFVIQPTAVTMTAEVSPLAAWLDAGWRSSAATSPSRPKPARQGSVVEVSRIKRRIAAKKLAETPPAEPAAPPSVPGSRRPLGLRRLSPQEFGKGASSRR